MLEPTLKNLKTKNPSDPPLPTEFVYIQKSKSGTLSEIDDDYYTLHLKGNSLEVIYFADQPNRVAGQEELTPFFEAWGQNPEYASKPPTAFINYTDFNANNEEGVTPDVLELNDPVYDQETDTISFRVKPLHEHQIKQGSLENVVIIYDKN